MPPAPTEAALHAPETQLDSHPSRSALRLRARGQAEIRVGMTGCTPNIARNLINVSLSGALVEVSASVDLGRMVEARFYSPESRRPVVRIAKVVRCDVSGERIYLGLRFENPMAGPDLSGVTYPK
ncbi:MAG TPA: PilZ domain-containing protein [Gemmatales bacterium]|nr:PilZ domain-containing protein [Gemmatales bacterium]